MKKVGLLSCLLACALAAFAQEMDPAALSQEEAAAVAAILARAREEAPAPAKQVPLEPAKEKPAKPAKELPPQLPPQQEEDDKATPKQCLTVAFVDIDEAFNAHPRTVAVKEQIRAKILAKEEEVRSAKELITVLQQENTSLASQLREIKPFYQRVVVETKTLSPRPQESQNTLAFDNLISHLAFAAAGSVTPLNTPAKTEDLTAKIAANKRIIREREFFIDNYRYQTREEILELEKKEVNEILQDIYSEIKTFAKKRNIGAIVRKDEILYGEKPVNVTKDFINRLQKSKKYRKRGK